MGEFGGEAVLTATRTGDGVGVTIRGPLKTFVQSDGLVAIGDGTLVFGRAPLEEDTFTIVSAAAEVLAGAGLKCRGTIKLVGQFTLPENGVAEVVETWSATGLNCNGSDLRLRGTARATRMATRARVSQILESDNPLLVRAVTETMSR